MSKEAVERVLGRVLLDNAFRESLFADPDKVLTDYELTEKEVAALKAIDYETMESFAARIGDQMSRSEQIGLTGAVGGITGVQR